MRYKGDRRREIAKNRHKIAVSNRKGYEYINSYFKGDILPNGDISKYTYIRVKHVYCSSIYLVIASSFINRKDECGYCCGKYENSIEFKNPEIAKLICDSRGNKIARTKFIYALSNSKYYFKCKECGKISEKVLSNVLIRGFNCDYCSDGKKFPNKFMYKLLDQLRVNYIVEYTKPYLKKAKIDIVIPEYNIAIENDGHIGHGNYNFLNGEDGKSSKKRDMIKEERLMLNECIKTIRIDCRYPDITYREEYIRRSIESSELGKIFDLSIIDWNKCNEFACKSLLIEVCKLWNTGRYKSAIELGKEFNVVTNKTISDYLNIGSKLGITNYNGIEVIRKNLSGANNKRSKKIICISTKKIFDTIEDAKEFYNIYGSNISECIRENNRYPYAGVWQGIKLVWCLYDEYLKMSNDEILKRIDKAKNTRNYRNTAVVLLNTGELFDSCIDASRKTGICYDNIIRCCKKNKSYSYAGKLDNGELAVWRYENEYVLMTRSEVRKKVDDINREKYICLTTGKRFKTLREASEFYKIKNWKNISACLRGKSRTCGEINGIRLQWDYLNY